MIFCAESPLQIARDDAGWHTLHFCIVEDGLGRRSVRTWQLSETAGKRMKQDSKVQRQYFFLVRVAWLVPKALMNVTG